MIRVVIENVLLLLLPTLLYVIYVYVAREEKPSPARVLDDAPLLALFIAGALVVVASLVFFSSSSGGRPGQTYAPPVFKDGRIEPGRLEPGRTQPVGTAPAGPAPAEAPAK